MKIGIIQTQRLGDIIIVLPIAQWFADQGHQVYWPVQETHLPALAAAAPDITFLPIDPALEHSDPIGYFLNKPLELLRAAGCETIHQLYTHLEGDGLIERKLLGSLKFDEYKYALTGVPFAEKWNLRLVRDRGRELALHKSLGIIRDYVLVHCDGSVMSVNIQLPEAWSERYQIVRITPLTDNPFDWIHTIEHAARLVMLDSSFANLAEGLNIDVPKYLVLRNLVSQTPVYRNGWKFCWPFDPIPA